MFGRKSQNVDEKEMNGASQPGGESRLQRHIIAIKKGKLWTRFEGLSRKKRFSILAGVMAVVVAGAYLGSGLLKGEAQAAQYAEAVVDRGDVQVTISGTGTIQPIDQYEVTALVQGKVTSDTFDVGDQVTEGQLLYVVDSSDVQNSVEKAQLSLEKSALSYDQTAKQISGLTVKAPISGRVSQLHVAKGDSVQKGAKLATIVEDQTMTLKVPFNINDVGGLYAGQPVTVTVENTFEQLSGTISKVYNSKRVLDGYITVTDVEISVNNPGGLTEGTYATATAGSVVCEESGTLSYTTEKLVTAEASGIVSELTASVGEYLGQGSVIMKLSSDSAGDDLKSSQLSLKDAELSYENTQKQLEDYNITSPIAGSVIEKTIKAGDTIDSSTSKEVMAIIADLSTIVFDINVDELDIAKMKVGQEVSITADALTDQVFTGYVENVGINGTTSNGTTTYPVRIVVNEPEGLLPGMNVSADIVVESASDVLRVPVAAVNRGNTVLVKDEDVQTDKAAGIAAGEGKNREDSSEGADGKTAASDSAIKGESKEKTAGQSAAPEGYQYVRVTLGLNDANYIEVADGLKEGDQILVPAVTGSSQTTDSSSGKAAESGGMAPAGGMSPGGGMPSGGGGMPSGGMGSGGGNRT